MHQILSRADVEDHFPRTSWQRVIFEDFAQRLVSEDAPFPCIYGVSGFKQNNLRFSFFEEPNAVDLGTSLLAYVKQAPSLGTNTSFVTFFAPDSVLMTVNQYQDRFWALLDEVARIDKFPWPTDIPRQIDHPDWEFCFAGQPMFVVCNTPAHVARKSRASAGFMMTFQPRYVFNGLLGSAQAARRATAVVRSRLAVYDFVPPSPLLGLYGDTTNREYAQYFLEDTNNEPPRCPFHELAEQLGDIEHRSSRTVLRETSKA